MKVFGEPYDSILFDGISEFNPMQEMCMKTGFLEGRSLVVSSPTSSGKTLIAKMAIVANFIRGGKSIYLSPLRSLAREKYEEFKPFRKFGMKVKISTGDLDSGDVGNPDLLVTTSEKLDSLFRHDSPFLSQANLLVADEIHMINDVSRGPTLEMNLTRFLDKQIVGLSATIPNADEIAEWLGAELVVSDYRPVELELGILHGGLLYLGDEEREVGDDIGLIRETLEMGKQILVFVSSRRSAESYALKLSRALGLDFKDSKKVLVIDPPTPQCEKLEESLRGGVAFHHAGLHPRQREMIEEWFRKREIGVIVATPTLAMGVNLPAFRVLVRDMKRFAGGYSDFIPPSEILQMLGRAGRPKYDERGEGIIYAKTAAEARVAYQVIISDPEPIYSKLSVEPVLRSHILAMISEGASTEGDILKKLGRTFFSFQYGSRRIGDIIGRIMSDLLRWGMIEEEGFGRIVATDIGRRTSQLYIDPLSAYKLIQSFGSDDFGYLFAISVCSEMMPLIRKEVEAPQFYTPLPDDLVFDHIASISTASFLWDWMSEMSERELFEKYGITPGGIYQKVRNAEWLLYSAKELALVRRMYEEAKRIEVLMRRVKHGVREELLPLVQIKGIGRKRARKLFDRGITTPTKFYSLTKEERKRIMR